MEKLYSIYYDTDRPKLLRSNITEQQKDKFLESLTLAEKTHIIIRPLKQYSKEEEER